MAQQETAQSNVPNETILYYTHELTRSKRKIHEANSAHRLLVKRAKNDGVPTEAILESVAWARLEPEVRRQKLIDRIRVEAARYPDNGQEIVEATGRLDTRVSDKARAEDTMFTAEQRGYDDGRSGVPVDANPYPVGSEFAQIWRRYWNEGQAANAMQLGENAKQASTRRERDPAAPKRAARAAKDVPLPLTEEAPRKRRGRPRGNGSQQPAAA